MIPLTPLDKGSGTLLWQQKWRPNAAIKPKPSKKAFTAVEGRHAMSETQNAKTHKEIIQMMAQRLGNHHKPCVYIKAIKDEYGIEVTNSSLTKSLGSFWSRLQTDESLLMEYGKKLLRLCHNDKGLASYIIAKSEFA